MLSNPYHAYFPPGYTTLHPDGLIAELNAELVTDVAAAAPVSAVEAPAGTPAAARNRCG